MEIIIVAIIAWLIAPIPLTIILVINKKKQKKQEQMLMHLFMQKRLTEEELQLAGMKLPPAAAAQKPAAAAPEIPLTGMPVPPAAAPQPQTTEQALADAAAKAARIAEAELEGKPLSEMPLPEPAEAPEPEIPDPFAASVPAAKLPEPELTAAPDAPAPEAAPETIPEAAPAAGAEPVTGAEPQAIPAAEFSPAPEGTEPQTAPPAPPAPPYPAVQPKHLFSVSAITVMLSVGVLLIITAGLIFVRSAWANLSSLGRLATLAAGSGLFFGTSALARRIWKLERTGMAFFTLGAAFLPISVWTACYLNLLGDGLSGVDNPWSIALAAGAFTVIALISVKMYHQLGWSIAALTGLTVTYGFASFAIVPETDTGKAVFLILIAVYAVGMCFLSRILRQKQLLPVVIGRVIEPFALAVTGLVTLGMFYAIPLKEGVQLSAAAIFLTAIAYFSPAVTERMREGSAFPASIMVVLGFGQLFSPFYRSIFTITEAGLESTYPLAYFSMLLMICAMLWLILLLTNSLPDHTRKGYFYAAFVCTALMLPMQLPEIDRSLLIVPAASVVLLVVWLIAAHKKPSRAVTLLITAHCWVTALEAGRQIMPLIKPEKTILSDSLSLLIYAAIFGLFFLVFVLTKKHRTAVSDLVFTLSTVISGLLLTGIAPKIYRLLQGAGIAVTVLMIVLYWFMALRHDTKKPVQYVYAALTPLLLFILALLISNCILVKVDSVLITIGWSITSIAIGMTTYLTTKRRFHGVRKLLFALCMLPPLLIAVFGEAFDSGKWIVLQQIICAAAAGGLWFLFANRGFRKLEIASFSTMLLLLTESTVYLVRDQVYDGEMNYTVWMIASLWIILFSVLAIVISKRILLFVGNAAIPAVMQIAAPFAVLILSVMLLNMGRKTWDTFYFIFTFGVCLLAWFVTKKRQIILPSVAALAGVFSVEALRRHNTWCSDGLVAVVLFCFAVMTLLLPYIGTAMREAEDDPADQRRAWVLTGLGGIMPFWLIEATAYGTVSGCFSNTQTHWMIFFVPVLLAGYIMHFTKVTKTESARNTVITVASALGMIAFWMQPLVDVKDTYLEGKLHILPMIAFGIVLRYLYGEKTGGGFLFGVGVYAMLRLTLTAIATEDAADLITLLTVALVMFVASFYIKQKKWFLLGGISLILTAAYMHMKLTDGTQWWVYLLLTGLILIVVAASNEMLKQRGDSLKNRAGRLWEDWKW